MDWLIMGASRDKAIPRLWGPMALASLIYIYIIINKKI